MPSNAPKDTLTDLTSKAYENSTENKHGKISSTAATYSTDLTGNGDSAAVEGNCFGIFLIKCPISRGCDRP